MSQEYVGLLPAVGSPVRTAHNRARTRKSGSNEGYRDKVSILCRQLAKDAKTYPPQSSRACQHAAESFLVSVKRPVGAAAKKNTTGRCFFFAAATRGRSLTHCGPGWCLPLAGVVSFFAAAPPGPGWCFFFCCGPARTLTHSLWAGAISARFGWCFFFFLLRPRADAHSLTAGLGGDACLRRSGLFFAAAPPGPGWCSFFAVAPPGPTLTHCGLGRFRQGRMVFFFCCGPAGSFLVSLKRPGGAAAKKKHHGAMFFFFCCGPARTLTHSLRAWVVPPPRRGGVFFCCGPARTGVVFFFCCGPARSLTHSLWAGAISARPGWCFFLLRPRPYRGGVFFFLLWPRPVAHSLTVGWGDFGKARVVFFFLLRPRLVFLDNSKKCLVYYIGSKKTRRGHNKKKTPLPYKS